ncbi:MAG TPA: VOC family protein [Candidatus Sulfotelmatobacter sp.]|nr:VOC family protein [Candidatus Sulfotelmatobacter sp.]
MSQPLSRRLFLLLTTGAVTIPTLLLAENEGPSLLDHILVGSPDLQAGIEFVEKKTGVLAAFGGVHPGRGTQNALLSLGERRYLEIIAPDPAQPGVKNPIASNLQSLKEPRLVGWAAHPGSIAAFAEKLRTAGIMFEGPTPGSRKRPDGQLLKWQTLNLADTASALLPFFIEWNQDSVHPSADAPKGCELLSFAAETPDPEKFAARLKSLGLDLSVKQGQHTRLRAAISGPKGNLEMYS